MNTHQSSFRVGIEFDSVLRAISKQIYDTPHAFIRENVQNAIDAVRIQALREGRKPDDKRFHIEISVKGCSVTVWDNGVGMSRAHLRDYFWTIGSSGKRGKEARVAGCVGMFGIGGFANFGVCASLQVTSQDEESSVGTQTCLSADDIRQAGTEIPKVSVSDSEAASPRGTIVVGELNALPDAEELKTYLYSFVRYVPIKILFNGKRISQQPFLNEENQENLKLIGDSKGQWRSGEMILIGRLWEDRGHTLIASIEDLRLGNDRIFMKGRLRFENGTLEVFKRGFKLCTTQVPSAIGISGRLDCDIFTPTAGRDSLDAGTTRLLGQIGALLEELAVATVLDSSERIAQHTRIFRFIQSHSLIHKMDNVVVGLADGSETSLANIKRWANEGQVHVFFGSTQKHVLNQVMQAQGHVVVQLSSDRFRRAAERTYLEKYCRAKSFEGIIDCTEVYESLSQFERIFLSEIEQDVLRSYEVNNFNVVAGCLTEDVPAFVRERSGGQSIEILVDVRHSEVQKLEKLGLRPITYSLISRFCREYLGPSLKKWSPRFFGDGAINLELFARRRSELWILVKDDIGVVRKGGQRQIFTRQDVVVVNVTDKRPQSEVNEIRKHRILNIVDDDKITGLAGFYIRLPDRAYDAYGDLVSGCDSNGVVWAGNMITFVASDGVSAQFQYQIRLDEIVATEINGTVRVTGAMELDRPRQEMFAGLYFSIPSSLEQFLVPRGEDEIRLNLDTEWIDMRTGKLWELEASDG